MMQYATKLSVKEKTEQGKGNYERHGWGRFTVLREWSLRR